MSAWAVSCPCCNFPDRKRGYWEYCEMALLGTLIDQWPIRSRRHRLRNTFTGQVRTCSAIFLHSIHPWLIDCSAGFATVITGAYYAICNPRHSRFFYVAWRTALRCVWRLPHNSHSRPVSLLADYLPLYDCFCRRGVKFAASWFNSDSRLVRTIFVRESC